VEAFTAVWTQHSTAESQALFNISRNTTRSILAVAELHVCEFGRLSGPCNEPFAPPDGTSVLRGNFYAACGYPDVFFDGQHPMCGATSSVSQMQGVYQRAIDNASRVPGNVSIRQSATYASDQLADQASIYSTLTGTFNAVTYLVEQLGQQNFTIGAGSNDIGWVVRETVANRPVSLTAGQTTEVDGSAKLNATWSVANLSVVTFVQSNSTKVIENANIAPVTNRSTTSFDLLFAERGLPNGTSWSVTLNGTTQVATGPLIRFLVPAGTYNFNAAASGYRTEIPPSNATFGVVTTDGANMTVHAGFSRQSFLLTFHEAGLPLGTGWGVLIGNRSETSFSSNVTYSVVDGTYGYLVLAPPGYLTAIPGPAIVNGTNTVVLVAMFPQPYPIVFVEFGLPAGANWSVTVSNNTTGFFQVKASFGSSIIFFLSNGTYLVTFTLPSGFAANGSSTSLTVAGEAVPGPVLHVHGPSAPTATGSEPNPWTDPLAAFATIPLAYRAAFLAAVASLAVALVLGWRHRRNRLLPPPPTG
jgi:hypothetical protein